jgi:hypothetical protein
MPTKTKAEPAVTEEEIIAEQEVLAEAPEQPTPLVGGDLLAFYNQRLQEGLAHREIAREAGYFSMTEKGVERVLSTQFDRALLEAQGFPVSKGRAGSGRTHAGLSRARVSGSGILLVSQLAVRNVGAEAGAVFDVSYPGDGQILLSPTGEVTPIVRRKGGAEDGDNCTLG